MSDTYDMGFDAVLAGEIYKAEAEVTAAVSPLAPIASEDMTAAAIEAKKILLRMPVMTWPELAKLAREMAMNIKERHVILKDAGLNEAQYAFLETHNEFYRNALTAACLEWHAPLSTQERIKVEAAAIVEDCLIPLGARMQNRSEGLPGVVEAFKAVAKVAGLGERENGGAPAGERFVINIDLGGDQKLVVSTQAEKVEGPKLDLDRLLPANPETT